MNRIIAVFLSCILILVGCTTPEFNSKNSESSEKSFFTEQEIFSRTEQQEVNFPDISEPELLEYVEENVYTDLVTSLNSTEYLVENVSAKYISNEYLEEVAYNSQANIYFGYTLSDLDKIFQGESYIFTLGDDGNTTVQAPKSYDDTYEKVIKNIAIGTGVILICVTVSVISGGVGASVVSMIFAASAKSGTVLALSSGTVSAITAGIVTGYETKDFNKAVDAAVLAGSEAFKWGAITGSFSGGMAKAKALKGATLKGLTMNEAARIQKESKLDLSFIKNFSSVEEYNVYKEAGLQPVKVNGKWAYSQKIDWDFVGSDGRTNAQRVQEGYAPLDSSGKSYELHHIGQEADSPLAILTSQQHHGNDRILHDKNIVSKINRTAFSAEKKQFWKDILDMTQKAG